MGTLTARNYPERARALRPLIAAEAGAIEKTRRLTASVVNALIDGGFYRLLLPQSLGGGEAEPHFFMEAVEELAKADASTAWCVGQCAVCAMAAAYLDREPAAEIWKTPRDILAWGAAGGEAREAEGGYHLTGTWHFASGCRQATWLGAHVRILDAEGKPRLKPDGTPLVRTLLFPLSSATVTDVWHVIGLNGTGTDDYAVRDLFVPAQFAATRDDPAEAREKGPLYKLTTSMVYGLGFAAIALGVARATLDAAVELAGGKKSAGIGRAMRDNNVVHATLGRNEASLRAARTYLYSSLEEVWRALQGPESLTREQRIALRLSSTWTIHQAASVVDAAYRLAGANAVFAANPFERRFRDMHAIAQQIQARDIHYETVGQAMLGLDPDAPVFNT